MSSTSGEVISVLYLDDQDVFLEPARTLLPGYDSRIEVTTVDNVEALKRKLSGPDHFDIIMLDYQLITDPSERKQGGDNGLTIIPTVRALAPSSRIVLISAFIDLDYVAMTARELDVEGMISKRETWAEIANGLVKLADPGVERYVSPKLRMTRRDPRPTGLGTLTESELRYLQTFVKHPQSRDKLAAVLHCSPAWVDTMRRSVNEKVRQDLVRRKDPRGEQEINPFVVLQWASEKGLE